MENYFSKNAQISREKLAFSISSRLFEKREICDSKKTNIAIFLLVYFTPKLQYICIAVGTFSIFYHGAIGESQITRSSAYDDVFFLPLYDCTSD